MLDDDELKRVVVERNFIAEKLSHPERDVGNLKVEWFRRVSEGYESVTGVQEADWNKVLHHRLSLYGPPCSNCGKPLRTPQARVCGACMAPVSTAPSPDVFGR